MNHNEYKPLEREYARIASRYDVRWKNYTEISVRETLQRLHVGADDRILDIGCGTGVLLHAVSLKAPQAKLAGVDLSKEMLETARRKLGTSADLHHAYAENLPFENALFDIVVSTNNFHFFRRPVAVLKEIRRVLKPGGRVVVTDWCGDYLTCRFNALFLRVFGRAHYRTYSSGEYCKLLEEAGFMSPVIERYKISWFWGLMTATAGSGLIQ